MIHLSHQTQTGKRGANRQRQLASNEVTGLQAGGYLVKAGFGAPADLKAGVLNQQGKRIKTVAQIAGAQWQVLIYAKSGIISTLLTLFHLHD